MKNEKECIHCKDIKSLDEFNRKSSAKDGYDSRCKTCLRNYQDTYNRTGERVRMSSTTRWPAKTTYSMAPWKPRLDRIEDVVIAPNEDGEYRLRINGGDDLPASDIEVLLWLQVENLTARLEMIGG